jgi:hypothetical protein
MRVDARCWEGGEGAGCGMWEGVERVGGKGGTLEADDAIAMPGVDAAVCRSRVRPRGTWSCSLDQDLKPALAGNSSLPLFEGEPEMSGIPQEGALTSSRIQENVFRRIFCMAKPTNSPEPIPTRACCPQILRFCPKPRGVLWKADPHRFPVAMPRQATRVGRRWVEVRCQTEGSVEQSVRGSILVHLARRPSPFAPQPKVANRESCGAFCPKKT